MYLYVINGLSDFRINTKVGLNKSIIIILNLLSIAFLESLILAQSERWRRA